MNYLYQEEQIVFEMIYGTIVVVVILKETVCLQHNVGQIISTNLLLFNKRRENVPNTVRYVQVVDENIV